MQACSGTRGLFFWNKPGQSKNLHMVPLKEMTEVVRVAAAEVQAAAEMGGWVRIKRGAYGGDLGKVVNVYTGPSGRRCVVQVVPRIDLPALSLNKEAQKERRRLARNGTVRPPRRMYSRDEVESAGGEVDRRRCTYFDGRNLDWHASMFHFGDDYEGQVSIFSLYLCIYIYILSLLSLLSSLFSLFSLLSLLSSLSSLFSLLSLLSPLSSLSSLLSLLFPPSPLSKLPLSLPPSLPPPSPSPVPDPPAPPRLCHQGLCAQRSRSRPFPRAAGR